ncbi:MAG: hypothetical protein H7X99_03535, partial [Saprospiraceae bacterium]|nr:hypothetical protein [Saprospiraceae bacterium]
MMAQGTKSASDVRAMFSPNTRNLWVNHLSGYIDGKHSIDMILGTDGHTSKGLYTLRNSGTIFYFEGEETDRQLRLVEMNGDSRFTGFIYGNYDGKVFEGLWMNVSKDISLPMKLVIVPHFEHKTVKYCDNHQWYQVFSGKVENKNVSVSISKDHDLYTCTVRQDGKSSSDIIPVQKEDRVIHLDLSFANPALNHKWAVLDTANIEKIDIKSVDENGDESITPLKSDRRLVYECYEYADYYSRLECVRPLTGNNKFDVWMETAFKEWVSTNLKIFKSIESGDIGTNERWLQTAYGWVDVDLF